ncbi:MAG: hypothetical protein ACD_3C00086G0006 [uncultured bacterium (gcode 4)]|uniref:Lipoprotein n=1 Tax=uncultured bacterium (gcode 4) TaxID=1234023 RepID=K2G1S9_9BACT|nr:MAG: hypothetical protein ACD_3C00086G0006 [uncultured bacterium (gcode 4)]
MKKFTALAVFPLIALASCTETKETTPTTILDAPNNEIKSVSTAWTENTENLDENISSVTTDSATAESEKTFEFSYEIWGKNVPVKWKFLLKDWKVTSMTFDWVDLNWKWPLVEFAKNAPAQVIWHELKWLKIDVVSWASLTTEWFNKFLSTVN